MKKLTASIIAFAALSATSAFADTPVVREMNTYDHILAVSSKNRALANNASEFVIYHQDANKPCPKDKKGKKEAKKEGKHHGHHDKMEKKEHHKKAEKPAAKVKKASKPAAKDAQQKDDSTK